MRWFFLTLVVVNLGIFIWGYQHERMITRTMAMAKPGVGNLRLLSERKPVPVVAVRPEPVLEVTQKGAAVALLEEEGMTSEAIEAAVEPASITESTEPAEPKQMAEAKLTTPAPVIPAEQERIVTCYRLGDMELQDVADAIADRLEDYDIEAVIQSELEQIEAGFWVVIPPLATDDEARQKVRDLKESGIRDVWRFTGGDKKNAISLGLFSRRINAESVKREAEDRGFDPKVQPRYRENWRYWLEFKIMEALPEGLQRQLEADYPKLELISQACP